MRINAFSLSNCRSFREVRTIECRPHLNLLVGPNGGGKSNLLDALNIFLRQFILPGISVSRDDARGLATRKLNRVQPFSKRAQHLSTHHGHDAPQVLEMTLSFHETDLENAAFIQDNVVLIEAAALDYTNGSDFSFEAVREWQPEEVEKGCVITVRVEDWNPIWTLPEGHDWLKEYITGFQLYALLLRDAGKHDLRPPFIYFSPFRGALQESQFQANLSQAEPSQQLASAFSATSRSQTSLIQAATLHFAEKYRLLQTNAHEEGFQPLWEADDEVKLVKDFLGRLGYDFKFREVDPRRNVFQIDLVRGELEFNASEASSGEQEILNFILALFALHLKDGILVIDEAELHLHPRWQALLLEILSDLSHLYENQVIISTHSAHFITPRSVRAVTRIFKDGPQSNLVSLGGVEEGEARDLLHVVNAHNNARLFFSDSVVLVEGVQDRLVFSRLIDLWRRAGGIQRVVEVLETHGKYNFGRYTEFLNRLSVPWAIIADQDYAVQISNEGEKPLFATNEKAIDQKVLKSKKSQDRLTLIGALKEATEEGDTSRLAEILEYLDGRHTKLREDLSEEEEGLWHSLIARARSDQVHLLVNGEIEDYLPEGAKDVEGTLQLCKQGVFEKWLTENKQDDAVRELVGTTRLVLAPLDEISEEAFWELVAHEVG